VLELEQHQGRDRADLMERIRGLEDKTSRELSQAFAEVNRVLAEHKKRDDAALGRLKTDRVKKVK
jgi:hypothetical protein